MSDPQTTFLVAWVAVHGALIGLAVALKVLHRVAGV